jgi:hypothetical protein
MRFVRCKTTSGYEAMILTPAWNCPMTGVSTFFKAETN